jgi:hypothetical protein
VTHLLDSLSIVLPGPVGTESSISKEEITGSQVDVRAKRLGLIKRGSVVSLVWKKRAARKKGRFTSITATVLHFRSAVPLS